MQDKDLERELKILKEVAEDKPKNKEDEKIKMATAFVVLKDKEKTFDLNLIASYLDTIEYRIKEKFTVIKKPTYKATVKILDEGLEVRLTVQVEGEKEGTPDD